MKQIITFSLIFSLFSLSAGLNGMGNPHEVTVSQDSAFHITRMPKDIHSYLMTFLTDYSSHNDKPSKFGTIRNIKSFMSTNRQFSSYDRDKVFMESILDFLCTRFPENGLEETNFVNPQAIVFPLRIEHAFVLRSPGAQESIRGLFKNNKDWQSVISGNESAIKKEVSQQELKINRAQDRKKFSTEAFLIDPRSGHPISLYTDEVQATETLSKENEIKIFRGNITRLEKRLKFIEALKK